MSLKWGEWVALDKNGLSNLKDSPSVYRVSDGDEIVYIGQTKRTKARMRSHLDNCQSERLSISVVHLNDTVPHRMLEMENDLIGSFVEIEKTIPRLQFSNSF